MATTELRATPGDFISPWLEMGAYEALWTKAGATFKTIADKFRSVDSDAVPSTFVQSGVARATAKTALEILHRAGVRRFGVRVHGAGEYPARLREAQHPVEFLYYQGWWDLISSPCVAVVGTRQPSAGGEKDTENLVHHLVQDGYTIVSGLARGIDTIAHTTAERAGGRTIAVIGTPLSRVYPRENAELQKHIAEHFLVFSQVPVVRYSHQGPRQNRIFFPERNITMSALTKATIIVEAGETSGTLVQARAAIRQGRKLFIMDRCFQNPRLTWPSEFEKKGAIRVRDYEEMKHQLAKH